MSIDRVAESRAYRRLARAVIKRAVDDARARTPRKPCAGAAPAVVSAYNAEIRKKLDAEAFLFEIGGQNELDFRFWCELAGSSPEVVRRSLVGASRRTT